jgi:hypothetical protein
LNLAEGGAGLFFRYNKMARNKQQSQVIRIDAKYRQMALRLVLVHCTALVGDLGAINVCFPWSNGN